MNKALKGEWLQNSGAIEIASGIAALGGLTLVSMQNYLLFHLLVELFTIAICMTLFIVAWNSRRTINNQYILFIGIAYLFVALLDTFHTLSYKGMYMGGMVDANTATQLWLAARFVQSFSLLAAPSFLNRRLNGGIATLVFSVITALLLASIYLWHLFPPCYVEGVGVTPFKIVSEYILAVVLSAALYLLYANRSHFDADILRWIGGSIVATIGYTLAFTRYVAFYDIPDLIGHLLRIIAFYLIYRAIVETGFSKPYHLLFGNLIRQQEALREEKKRTQTYLDSAGIIVILNTDQTIALINKAGCQLLGYEEREVIGKRGFDMFIPERIRDELKATFSRLLEGGCAGIDFHENPILTRSGEERAIRWQNRLLKDNDGRITGTISTGQDITEWKKIEAEQERLASFPLLNPNPIVEVDLAGQVQFLNPAAERLFPELRQRGPAHPWMKSWDAVVRLFLETGIKEDVREINCGERWYHQTICSVDSVERIRIYGLDITKRKQAEENLLKSHEELEQRVHERTQQLDTTNRQLMREIEQRKSAQEDLVEQSRALERSRAELERRVGERTAELEAANKELESFSYSVSHDLKAPLRAIDGSARMILMHHDDQFDEATKQKFTTIRSNVRMMGQLIEDLLAFSRLGRKEITLSKLNMNDLLADAWKELHAINAERKMTFTAQELPGAFGDRTLIKQVLLNLLSNAIKFTKSRDCATIETGSYTDGQYCVYYVKDNGIGFDMAYHDKMFGVFQRLHSDEDYEGTGVGLAIVQRIIHRHGGRVWAQGVPDRGACFSFALKERSNMTV